MDESDLIEEAKAAVDLLRELFKVNGTEKWVQLVGVCNIISTLLELTHSKETGEVLLNYMRGLCEGCKDGPPFGGTSGTQSELKQKARAASGLITRAFLGNKISIPVALGACIAFWRDFILEHGTLNDVGGSLEYIAHDLLSLTETEKKKPTSDV